MTNRFRQTIAYRLFFAILSFSLSVTVLLAAVQLYVDYQNEIKTVEEDFEEIEKGRLKSLTESLWVMDRELLRAQLEGILNIGHIKFAGMQYKNQPIVSAGVPPYEPTMQREFPMYRTYDNRHIYIGTLLISASRGKLYEGLLSNIARAMFYQGTQVFLISLFLFFLFQFYVTRHLRAMAAYFNKQNPWESEMPLVLEGYSTKENKDEIGRVVTAINSMSANMRNAFSQIETELQKRKEAEKSLLMFRKLIDQSNDAIFVINPDTSLFLDVNHRACSLLGYDREDLLTIGVVNIATALPDRSNWKAHVEEVKNRGSMVLEDSLKRKGGALFPVEVNVTYITLEKRSYMLAVVRDITERKQAEDLLLKLSHAVEQSPVSIVISDSGGVVEFANPRFFQLTGDLPEEVIGRKLRFLQFGAMPEELQQRVWATISSGKVWNGELCNRKKTGELFWEAVSLTPIKNKDGSITHLLAIKEDITERKKLEDQLRQAQKMEAVGQLAGGIAHDFNNILSAIIGYGHLLRDKMGSGDPLRMNVDQILESAEKATEVSHSLLAFSRKQLINSRPVKVNDLISKFEKLICRIIGEDIELKTVLADKGPVVMADLGQMEQVLMNLANNARDAMPQGGSLTISTDLIEMDDAFVEAHGYGRNGSYALISVSDTGVGMNSETRTKIFEPLFTTKEPGKGTGLGLAMVYGIIKQHDGFIDVYSEPGKGTHFKIYLPATEAVPAACVTTESVSAVKGGTETILVAEDDEKLRKLSEIVLKQYGYRVISAENGQDAINKFREHMDKIQLVILDMIMPGKSGKEAYDEIKLMRPEMKVIFSSGYTADRIDKHKMLEDGFAFLMKPVSPRDLLAKVREVLDKR
jgi:two-component system NtrC family sensor kinase